MTFAEILGEAERIGEKLKSEDITQDEAKTLYAALHGILASNMMAFWRVPPLAVNTIMIVWNGRTMTPPMCFGSEDEANVFTGLHKPIAYLEIPKPPDLPDNLRKIQENGKHERG